MPISKLRTERIINALWPITKGLLAMNLSSWKRWGYNFGLAATEFVGLAIPGISSPFLFVFASPRGNMYVELNHCRGGEEEWRQEFK